MAARLKRTLLVLAAGLCVALVPASAGAAAPKNVKRVTDDYRSDGRIDPCRHSAKDLRDTRKAIEADTEQYAPDFRIAINAALKAREDGECEDTSDSAGSGAGSGSTSGSGSGSGGSGSGSGSTSGSGTGTDSADATPTPTPTSTPDTSTGEDVVTPALPPSSSDAVPIAPAPAVPSQTPTPVPTVPPAATAAPAPAGAGVTPGVPPEGDAKPGVILTRPAASDGVSIPLIVLGALTAAGLLAGLLALVLRRFGWGEERLAGVRHAWSEASYRTGGTWQDFTEWVRLGR